MTTEFKEWNADKDATKQLLVDIEELAPQIQSRSAEMEASGRIPTNLIESLRAIGVFRMFVPRSHGGLELDFGDGIEIIQTLARIDGSVGWSAMISNGGSVFATFLPPETYDRIYEKGPDVLFSGSLRSSGKAEATDHGWLLNGRWDFASGCQHATCWREALVRGRLLSSEPPSASRPCTSLRPSGNNGGGRLITTEFEPSKVARARNNLAIGGLLDLVEIREGDALKTLNVDLPESIDLLLLDGAKSLCTEILSLVESRLRPGAFIVADNTDNSPEYVAHFRSPENGYLSMPFRDNVELSYADWLKPTSSANAPNETWRAFRFHT